MPAEYHPTNPEYSEIPPSIYTEGQSEDTTVHAMPPVTIIPPQSRSVPQEKPLTTEATVPEMVVPMDDFLREFVGPDTEFTAATRGRAASALYHMARSANDTFVGPNAKGEMSADQKILTYVTDASGERQPAVSLHDIQELLSSGQNIHGLGRLGRTALQRVLDTHEVRPAERPHEHLTEPELRALFDDPARANIAIRAVRALWRDERWRESVQLPIERQVYERYDPPVAGKPNTSIVNVEKLCTYLQSDAVLGGTIPRLGEGMAASILPVLEAYLAQRQAPLDEPGSS